MDWPACVLLCSCVCSFGKCHAVSTGVLLACYSPDSLAADNTCIAGSCMPVPVCLCHLGSWLVMSPRVLCRMDASDIFIYVSQYVQTVTAKVRLQPWVTVREAAKWYDVLHARSMWLSIGVPTQRHLHVGFRKEGLKNHVGYALRVLIQCPRNGKNL
jgi:hypothetical protein